MARRPDAPSIAASASGCNRAARQAIGADPVRTDVRDSRHCELSRNRFAEPLAAAKVFAAVFVDGYHRLTDIAARPKFPVQAWKSVANVRTRTARIEGE
jgi:hypothetical protein